MFGSAFKGGWKQRFKGLVGRADEKAPSRDELEALLFEADLSAPIVERLLEASDSARSKGKKALVERLKEELLVILSDVPEPNYQFPVPGAILLLGVNGAGKTTVAGKLAHRWITRGTPVVLAAADTFRAGAIDQMKRWGERVGAEVVAQSQGSDPASVVFDAWKRAQVLGGVMIADTAGRLHTKMPLVEELRKIVRVMGKDGKGAPHETYLVLDGTSGQNAVFQSKEFVKAAPISGLIITKLDGTAKGGAAVSCSLELSVPIRYLGVGEKTEDLLPFQPLAYANELFE